MAVPTLTACAPSTVFTGGQLVTLTGTNFRGPYPLPASGPVPTPPPTVAITFDGVLASGVAWISATELTCFAPNHDPGSAVIQIQNLDSSGNPISGEAVSASGLVTYKRADLTVESDFTRLTRTLLLLMRQQIIDNVVQTVESDYTSDADRAQFNFVETATLPCVVLFAPTTKENLFYDWELTPERQTSDTTYEERRFMKTVDVTWKIVLLDDHQTRMQNLVALVQNFFTINNWLYMDRDPSNLPLGKVRYEMEADDFGSTGTPNNSNVRAFSGSVTVRGFTYEDVAGMPGTMLSRRGGTVEGIELYTLGERSDV